MGWPQHCCLHPKICPDMRAGRHGAAPRVIFGPLPAFWTPAGEGCTVPAHPAGPRSADPITSPKIHPFISARPRAYPSTYPNDVRQIAIALTHSVRAAGKVSQHQVQTARKRRGFCRLASPRIFLGKSCMRGAAVPGERQAPRLLLRARRWAQRRQRHGADLLMLGRSRASAGGGDVLSNTSATEIKQSARRVARRPRDRSKYPRRVPGSYGNNRGIRRAPRGLLTLPMWAFPAGMLRATRPLQLLNTFVSLSPLQATL